MELRNIRTFLRTAELLNFTRAAEELGYSQSAVTMQIRALETELGTPLFDRIGKKVSLTEGGRTFLRYAGQMLNAEEQARTALSGCGEPSGVLRIGTIESVCMSVFPTLLYRYHQAYPQVETVVRTGLTEELFDMLRQNDVDLIYYFDRKQRAPDRVQVFEEPGEVLFVAGAGYPLPDSAPQPLREIIREPLILTEKGVSYRYELDQRLAMQERAARPFLEIGNTEVIVRLLRANAGISFLPEFAVRRELQMGTLRAVPVRDCKTRLWMQLSYHKNKWVTPQMQGFLQLAREAAAELRTEDA